MDVRFQGGSIRTVCPATEGNSAVVKVGLASQAVKLSCPVFNVLPVMQELTLEKGPVTAHRWEVAQIDGNENQLEFRAAIRCGARKGRQEVMVTASADFAATQDCLNSQDCKQGSAIRAISTQEPHLYPHRIFSLGSALQLFYRDLKGVAPKFPLLNLAIEEGG